MRLSSRCSVLCVVVCTGVTLAGCSVLPARRHAASRPPAASHGKPPPPARAAAAKPEQSACASTDATGLSEAHKTELFRQFEQWQRRGGTEIAGSQQPSETLVACPSGSE